MTIEPELIIHGADAKAIAELAANACDEYCFVYDIVPLLKRINLKWPGLLSARLVRELEL